MHDKKDDRARTATGRMSQSTALVPFKGSRGHSKTKGKARKDSAAPGKRNKSGNKKIKAIKN